MLILLFHVGDDRYALDIDQIVEIIPTVKLRQIHHTPEYVAGSFNYCGKIVPVIDLCQLIGNQPSRSYLSTRIIIVEAGGPTSRNGAQTLLQGKNQQQMPYLGLMAERITETLNKPETNSAGGGSLALGGQVSLAPTTEISQKEAPYLGPMFFDDRGIIQQIWVEHLTSIVRL